MRQQLDELPQGVAQLRVRMALREIVVDRERERRAERRLPCFGPVTVSLPSDPEVALSAFARDVSPSGIGLVHLMPLDRGEVVVNFPLPSGKLVALQTELLWCRDYGNGWYASGGRFLDVL